MMGGWKEYMNAGFSMDQNLKDDMDISINVFDLKALSMWKAH